LLSFCCSFVYLFVVQIENYLIDGDFCCCCCCVVVLSFICLFICCSNWKLFDRWRGCCCWGDVIQVRCLFHTCSIVSLFNFRFLHFYFYLFLSNKQQMWDFHVYQAEKSQFKILYRCTQKHLQRTVLKRSKTRFNFISLNYTFTFTSTTTTTIGFALVIAAWLLFASL